MRGSNKVSGLRARLDDLVQRHGGESSLSSIVGLAELVVGLVARAVGYVGSSSYNWSDEFFASFLTSGKNNNLTW
jgi:hypothetical protein